MDNIKSKNIVWHEGIITKSDRQKLNGHRSACLWFTGLSGSGKSTIALELENKLFAEGLRSYVLDGDNIRHGLNKNLGFSPEDRGENIRRIGEVAKLFVDAGLFAMTAFISPYRADRDLVRNLFEAGEFIEIFVKCDIATCESRDPKGLYAKARRGEIPEFTGVSAPYEEPNQPEVIVDTSVESDVKENSRKVFEYLKENHYLAFE